MGSKKAPKPVIKYSPPPPPPAPPTPVPTQSLQTQAALNEVSGAATAKHGIRRSVRSHKF
jgi:hypothetical protein